MEHVMVVPFWTRRRLLRGALTPAQALSCGACATALLLWTRLLFTETSIPIVLSGVVIAPLAVAAFVDSVCHLLPDPLLLLASLAAVPPLLFLAASGEWRVVILACLTSMLALGVGLALSSSFSFGRGDAKLLAVLGVWLGNPVDLLAAVIIALVGAGSYAVLLLLLRRATRTTALALGPWLVSGAAVFWVVGA